MKLKSQKGAITVFVLIALLFYTAFLLLMYAANTNKLVAIKEKSDVLKGIYEKNTSNESITNIYNKKISSMDSPNEWTLTSDGKIKKGHTTLRIGDYVDYDSLLPTVTLNSNSTLMQNLSNYSGNTLEDYNTTSTIVQEKNLGWRIYDAVDGKIRLISANPTQTTVRLENYNGYNNGVYLLDQFCNTFYTVEGKGTSRCLKIEDVQNHLNYDYTQYSSKYTDTGKYGGIAEYVSSRRYPNIYPNEIGCKAISDNENFGTLNQSEQNIFYTGQTKASTKLRVTLTYWYNPNLAEEDFNNPIYYTLILKNGTEDYLKYWLSSRCVRCEQNRATYGIRGVSEGKIAYCCNFMDSWATNLENDACSIRPIVTLEDDVVIVKNSTNDGTTKEKACILR